MVDAPTSTNLMYLALGLLGGATAPTYYATERLRGFGRWVFSRLPYELPPGAESEVEAMVEVIEGKAEAEDVAEEQDETPESDT